jgi:YbgC/YbaW family acyl-CoA thioester hydrolase
MENSNEAIEIYIPITINRKVLFGDCDPEGIVYTPRFSYFALEATHEAMHIMLGAPLITALKKMGILTPVRAFDLEFLAPVTWDDELKLEVQVSEIKQHSFSFIVRGFLKADILAFSASITYVTVSSDKNEKIQVPEMLAVTICAKKHKNSAIKNLLGEPGVKCYQVLSTY